MRIKYIDVLKAFAIMAVVLYHTGLMTYGYLGVDLFLVIAGYLTTKSLSSKFQVSNHSVGGCGFYSKFEFSRIVRLLPPLLVAGVVCMLLGFFVMLPDDYENLSQSVIATNFFANNILAAITTKNYWDVVNEYKPLMHTWYVGVVMQFYIIYPILFFIANNSKKDPKKLFLTIVSTLAVISFLVYFATTDVAQRFYYLPSRFFEFAVGGIVALIYNPKENTPFGRAYVYFCYVLLFALMFINTEMMPARIRLVVVVGLSCVVLCSQDILENKVTGNTVVAKIGVASYSIFIWHQILLAFCRYTWTNNFTASTYAVLLVATAILSWLSYSFVEQGVNKVINSKGRKWLYIVVATVFVLLTVSSGYIYLKGGVVRDIPELYITKGESVNHKAYNDKIYKLDKPFETDKRHWLVVGNSFGRDFANVILESSVSDSVEVSYIYIDNYTSTKYKERFAAADKVFLSTLGVNESEISRIKSVCETNGLPVNNLIVVGIKNFGESNGQFYIKRNKPNYYNQRVKMVEGYFQQNEKMKKFCGENYLDIIGLVIDEDKTMPVFTPDHHFVSQDCRHFSMGGAKWFATLIDWNKYLK